MADTCLKELEELYQMALSAAPQLEVMGRSMAVKVAYVKMRDQALCTHRNLVVQYYLRFTVKVRWVPVGAAGATAAGTPHP